MQHRLTWSACACKDGGIQWLSADEPIVKIVLKMLEVIVTKPPSTTHKTMLLQRFHQVSALIHALLIISIDVSKLLYVDLTNDDDITKCIVDSWLGSVVVRASDS